MKARQIQSYSISQTPWSFTQLRSAFASLCFIILAACSGIPISYYDATTYTQLTALKAETSTLVEAFDSKPATQNEVKIEALSLSLRKAYEYERGKGSPNSDTARQFDKIVKLFNETVAESRANPDSAKSLGQKYFREAAAVLEQAFDIAIATENAKNKDKR